MSLGDGRAKRDSFNCGLGESDEGRVEAGKKNLAIGLEKKRMKARKATMYDNIGMID